MTIYTGALLPAIDAYLLGSTTRKFGLLVIDEQDDEGTKGELLTSMLETISFAVARGFKVVMVEINPGMTLESRQPTRAAFRAIIKDAAVLFKKGFNAFGVIDGTGTSKHEPKSYSNSVLDGILRGAGVNELIVLGRTATQCVRLTVTGGGEGFRGAGPPVRGALDYGYQVWTSPKIIDGDATAWTGTRGIKCYSLVV